MREYQGLQSENLEICGGKWILERDADERKGNFSLIFFSFNYSVFSTFIFNIPHLNIYRCSYNFLWSYGG